ncbi:MAG: glycosyltransferase [Candidatus Shapirobacteria bacterium]|nr:glycosyltransferase [Candidatus Shapirobacteria bacterium]
MTRRKRLGARKIYDLPEEALIITLPSRIIRRKGILEAVKATEIIRKKHSKVLLFLPAFFNPFDRNYATEIKDYISKKNLSEQIIFPKKQIDHKNMNNVYAASNLVLAPSYYEGLGLTVLEAMGMGIPVVACRVHGIRESIRSGYNGILVKQKDEVQLARAIEKIFLDKDLRDKIIKNGRKTVMSKFNIKQNISRTENVYHRLLG